MFFYRGSYLPLDKKMTFLKMNCRTSTLWQYYANIFAKLGIQVSNPNDISGTRKSF